MFGRNLPTRVGVVYVDMILYILCKSQTWAQFAKSQIINPKSQPQNQKSILWISTRGLPFAKKTALKKNIEWIYIGFQNPHYMMDSK